MFVYLQEVLLLRILLQCKEEFSHIILFRIDDGAKSFEYEHRSAVIGQRVLLYSLDTNCHELRCFRLCSCSKGAFRKGFSTIL